MNIYLDPSEPKMNVTAIGSRLISISWTIDEITRIQDFNIFSNTTMETFNKSVSLPNATMFSYNYTKDIKPFKRQVKFDSSYCSEDVCLSVLDISFMLN